MAAQSWTLKAELQGERRRLRDWVPVGEEPTVEAVRTGACRLFEIPPPEMQGLIFQYQDNEGDMCTLTELTLSDALCLCVESRTLRVVVGTAPADPVGNPSDPAGNPSDQFRDQVDRVRTGLQDGGARLRTSVEQLKTTVSSSLQEGRIRAHAQAEQFGASIQDSGSSLRVGAEQFGTHIQTGSARMRSTVGQIGSEIQCSLQEGCEGVRVHSQKFKDDLCGGCSRFQESFNSSVEVQGKTRVVSAIVAGSAALVVTRNLRAAMTVGAFAAGAASAANLGGPAPPSQEEPSVEPPVEAPVEPPEELMTVAEFAEAPLEDSQSAAQDEQQKEEEDEEEEEEENSTVLAAPEGELAGEIFSDVM